MHGLLTRGKGSVRAYIYPLSLLFFQEGAEGQEINNRQGCGERWAPSMRAENVCGGTKRAPYSQNSARVMGWPLACHLLRRRGVELGFPASGREGGDTTCDTTASTSE